MVLSLLLLAATLPALSVAQLPVVSSSLSASSHVSSASSPAVPASSPASSSAPAPSLNTPAISVSLLSVNPTAVPITQINSAEPPSSTIGLTWTTTPAAGAVPSFIPGAPPLPNVNLISPPNYPALDKVPDVTSSQVQQWIKDVQATGVQIPNIPQTVLGGCPANLGAAANSSICWWTCGGCVRDTDITSCPDKLTWGLTYDDGPAYYTPNLLQYMDQNNLHTTFFVVGSRAISFPALLQTEYMNQHQIAVHTWSHPYLTTLSNEQIIAELGWTKKIIKDVLGVTPNMMRPPYGDIDDRVRAISLAMGLTPVMWTRISPEATFDTGDFNIHGGTITSEQVLQNWEYILGNATTINTGFIVLEHDLFQQTVEIATGYILPDALAHTNPKFDIKPVISCLNKPMQDAYIETNDNKTNPQPAVSPSVPVSALSSGASGSLQPTGASSGNTSDAWRTATSLTSSLIAFIVLGAASILIQVLTFTSGLN